MRVLGVVLITGLFGGPLFAQNAASPQFDVVSIKPTKPSGAFGYPPPGPGQWRGFEATALGLIGRAHPEYAFPGLILGGPSWVHDDLFDVNARMNPGTSQAEVREMVRRMLADRFALRTHVEQRTVNVYLLKMARVDGLLGPNLLRSRPQCIDAKAPLPRECRAVPFLANGLRAYGTEISALPRILRSNVDRPVLDRTGLTGYFDFQIPFAESLTAASSADGGAAFFTAIQEQLGLKLEPARETMNVLVIDAINKPEPD